MNKILGRRGQALTWDVIFASMFFLVALGFVIYLWNTTELGIQRSDRMYEMEWVSNSVLEQLVRTSGVPPDWLPHNVVVFGLTEHQSVMGAETSKDRVLDPDKLLYFIGLTRERYSSVQRDLLGSSKYEFYLKVSCLNSSTTECFDGLPLDSVASDVPCSNGFYFTVGDGRISPSVWLEAEDVWNQSTTDGYCKGECSSDLMSRIAESPGARTVELSYSGYYVLWVRSYSDFDARHFRIKVDGNVSDYYGNHSSKSIEWERVGVYTLNDSVTLEFVDAAPGALVDSLLLTSDLGYNPNNNPLYYGNPHGVGECVVGNYVEAARVANLVRNVKTATFTGSSDGYVVGSSRVVSNRTVRVELVLWDNLVYAESTTTTSLPGWVDLLCTQSNVNESCSNHTSVYSIDEVKVSGDLECGEAVDVVVNWTGYHFNDRNFFGFYLDNGVYVDSCETNNEGDVENVTYVMTCTLEIPDASQFRVMDGQYNLYVTGEDTDGYCPPSSPLKDSMNSTQVTVSGCMERTDISCVGTRFRSNWPNTMGIRSIDSVSLNNPIECGIPSNLTVDWTGYHADGRWNYWSAYIYNGSNYINISSCYTQVSDADPSYYTMNCGFTLTGLADGNYPLVVTGNHFTGHCSPEFTSECVSYVTLVDVTGCVVPQPMAGLSVSPQTQSVNAGEAFNVNVNVSSVSDLYTAGFNLSFDSNVIRFDSITKGGFLGCGGAQTISSSTQGPGYVYFFVSRLADPAGCSGSGPLASVDFTALNPGSSGLDLSSVELVNSTPDHIAVNIYGGSVTVS